MKAVEQVSSAVEPATKDITSGVIRPGGEALSKNAVPVTESFARDRVEPAVGQVSPHSCDKSAGLSWWLAVCH